MMHFVNKCGKALFLPTFKLTSDINVKYTFQCSKGTCQVCVVKDVKFSKAIQDMFSEQCNQRDQTFLQDTQIYQMVYP